jgi:hypothetical protein
MMMGERILYRFVDWGWILELQWKPQDWLIGVSWENQPYRIDIWICIIPCLPIHYASPSDETDYKHEQPALQQGNDDG